MWGFDWKISPMEWDDFPEPAMGRLGLNGLPRGRIVAVSGANPERRQQRLWRWAYHTHEQGHYVLWLDPLALCMDRIDTDEVGFAALSPRSHEAVNQLLLEVLKPTAARLIILDNFDALRPESSAVERTASIPLKWRHDARYLATWVGLCWRYQCTMVIGRKSYASGRDPVDDHACTRFQISETRGSLQLLERRQLAAGPGWRRLPSD